MPFSARALVFSASIISAVALNSCTSSNDLATDLGDLTADYLIIDLTTGSHRTTNVIDDLTTNAAYRDDQMVFRRVELGGSTGASTGKAWLGVFEVTQGQWTRIATGTSTSAAPWNAVPTAIIGTTATGVDKPAFNLSYDDLTSVLNSWSTGRSASFGLPTEAEWNAAAGTDQWPWGNASDRATITAHAIVFETQNGTIGPRSVGQRSANARGFYDLAGNVWEWTAPGTTIRGGSWNEPLSAATTTNRVDIIDGGISSATAHALIGARLVARLP